MPEEAIEWGKAARLRGDGKPSAGAALKVALEIACRDEAAGKTSSPSSRRTASATSPTRCGAIKRRRPPRRRPPNMDKEAEVVQWKSSEYTAK